MPELSASELAEQYGFALSFMKSDPSLWKLFNQAVQGEWDPGKFVAKLRETAWYKRNGETVRQYQLLKKTDPATLAQRRAALRSQLGDAAAGIGAVLSAKNLNTVTENALMFGWNDNQIRDVLAGYVKAKNGVYHGSAGDDIASMQETAWRNGIHMTKQAMQGWSQDIAAGNHTVDFYKRRLRQLAKSLAPGYATELDAGMDLFDIAEPYMQAKAKLLELNPARVDLFDPDVRRALSNRDKDGKPASVTLWQFEQDMRKNPAWLKTQNAQDSVMGVAKKVLTDMGFQGV